MFKAFALLCCIFTVCAILSSINGTMHYPLRGWEYLIAIVYAMVAAYWATHDPYWEKNEKTPPSP